MCRTRQKGHRYLASGVSRFEGQIRQIKIFLIQKFLKTVIAFSEIANNLLFVILSYCIFAAYLKELIFYLVKKERKENLLKVNKTQTIKQSLFLCFPEYYGKVRSLKITSIQLSANTIDCSILPEEFSANKRLRQ